MSVHIFAFAVIVIQNMRRLEGENFSNAYHGAKIENFLNLKLQYNLSLILQIMQMIRI